MKKKFRIKQIKTGSSIFSNYPQYGIICVKSLSYGILTDNQLEAVRRCILRKIKRKGIIWIRVQCNYPITKKSIGSRMGKGVGSIKYYISNIKKGRILLELQTLMSKELYLLLKKISFKLPVKTCILFRLYY